LGGFCTHLEDGLVLYCSFSMAISGENDILSHLLEGFRLDKIDLLVHGATVVIGMICAISEIGIGGRIVIVIIVMRMMASAEKEVMIA